MARDPRYDILFEPVRIGPKTAKNASISAALLGHGWAWRRRWPPCAA